MTTTQLTTIRTAPEHDEIVLSLIEQKMVTHETVRINVGINIQRDPSEPEATMRNRIRAALKSFVNADWRYVGVTRQRSQTRFEVVQVQAVARVPEAENTRLVERANDASTPDLELVNPTVSYALPFDQVQKINSDLRVALVARAKNECDAHSKAAGQMFRVAAIEFADTPRMALAGQEMRAGRTYATANTATSAGYNAPSVGDAADEGSADLGVTERFWVSAQVTLRTAPKL